jgi:NAD(P)-dependent dehydrogenase (short-subunit alcohol dehydrogenase family)
MRISLTDQVALVTGSAHRVGKAIALELARQGVHIMVHYYGSNEETVRQTVREIKSQGVDAFSVRADVGTPEGVETIFAAVREHFDRFDILVNSASNFQKRTLMEVTYQEWQETMATNLTGPFLCTQAAVRLMRENDPSGGAIVNICDKGSIEPWPTFAHHGVSKAGLLALSQVSAVSLGPDIRVNAIIPGAVLKPEGYSEEQWQKSADRGPLKRPGSAEDVARAVTYLCQEDYLNGVVLRVDGGEYLL